MGLPAGATAVYTSGPTLSYYRHSDWLGSSRLASTPSRTTYYDGAYAAYGENSAETGTHDRNFTGQNQDIVSSGAYPLYDFLMREYHPTWGRWLSSDPAGLAAANPANPQSWNRYAYVLNNPTNLIDPLGLMCEPDIPGCQYGDPSDPSKAQGGMTCFSSTSVETENGVIPGSVDCSSNPTDSSGGGNGITVLPWSLVNKGLRSLLSCPPSGNAPSPQQYEAMGGTVTALGSPLANAFVLPNFHHGGALDAQAYGASRAYANYVYGVYMGAAGFSLPFSLWGANFYGAKESYTWTQRMQPDKTYRNIPADNVVNITRGYNDEKNGTLCSIF